MADILNIYTDGSCDLLSKYKRGVAAFIVVCSGEILHTESKCYLDTTNNRMELTAIINALQYIPNRSMVRIITDSQYCITVLKNRFKSQKCNMDLILKYRSISKNMKKIEFVWVKGHSGNKYNEMADEMAKSEYLKIKNYVLS